LSSADSLPLADQLSRQSGAIAESVLSELGRERLFSEEPGEQRLNR
jgi:hypothetical protein